MKTTLWKWIGLLSMLLFVFNPAGAKAPHNKSGHLLPLLLNDSLELKQEVNRNVLTAEVKLQAPVQQFVELYLEEHGEMLEQIKLGNSSRFKLIQTILVKRGIPAGLMYLAVVESKLKNNATSGAGAAGIWQLMPLTARTLGLKVNGKTDERRHVYQSSVAAAKYLNELYKQFDDWLLVVAAYNCGAGNVQKAIKKSGSREFWKLQRFLPAETRDHVKRFIATHFYYEEKGSLVTLTKKERTTYLASLNELIIPEPGNKKENSPSAEQHFNWVLIVQEEGELILLARK